MALTSSQIDQFYRDGYLGYGPLLEPEEVNVLLAHLMDLFVQENVRDNMAVRQGSDGVLDLCNLLQGVVDSYPGTMTELLATAIEHARTAAVVLGEAEARGEITYKEVESTDRFLQVRDVYKKDSAFADLVRDQRILDIAESLLGPNIEVEGDQALFKPAFHGGELPWHTDNGYWGYDPPNLITCWIALADVKEENGALRFIPGSNRAAPAEQRVIAGSSLQEMDVDESRARTVELPPGGCSWHHCLTQHQTRPNRTPHPRPSYSIIYTSSDVKDRAGNPVRGKLVRGGRKVD